MTEKAQDPPQASLPKVETRSRGRFSIVWLIPLGAVLIGGWLAYKTISEQGPSITIGFESADGLEPGKTKIIFKGLQAGLVDEIHVTPDLSSVTVHATLVQELKPHLNDGARFWVVRPKISVTGISGLDTLVSGDYIAFQPGSGKPARDFQGLKEPPVEAGDAAHRKFVLQTDDLGSLDLGSPVLYRGVTVGKVVAYNLPDDDSPLTVDIVVHDPHHKLVRENTQFWNDSGVKFDMGDLFDASLEIGSLKSLLAGGIVFATPAEPGPTAKADATFPLLSKQPAKQESDAGALAVVLKSPNLSSVKAGDPILYREFQVGRVVKVGLDGEAASVDLEIAIESDYAPLVKTNTVFWNASGINANFSLFSGASIDIESLRALLDGGIAFATPDKGGKPVKPGAVFALHEGPKEEWREWAPHIRLHKEADAAAKATAEADGKGSASGDAEGAAGGESQSTAADPEGDAAAESGASAMPTSVTLQGRVTATLLESQLEDLGFANISDIEKLGMVFHLSADWQGQPMKLRIDARDGEIEVMSR